MFRVRRMQPQQGGVEGKCLVIANKTAMPMRCIKTNEEIQEEDYLLWDLPCLSNKALVIMVILSGPFLLLFVPWAVRRRCKFKAGISKPIRRRYLLYKLAACALICIPVVTYMMGAMSESVIIMLYGASLFAPCVWITVAIFLFVKPMRNVREKDGYYWIVGCSEKYLESL